MSNWYLEDTCATCNSKLATNGDRIWCTHEQDNLKQENKQLREALKKCDPYADSSIYCYSCGMSINRPHTADCEYVRLTEESK